jgi:hypothetical protein
LGRGRVIGLGFAAAFFAAALPAAVYGYFFPLTIGMSATALNRTIEFTCYAVNLLDQLLALTSSHRWLARL